MRLLQYCGGANVIVEFGSTFLALITLLLRESFMERCAAVVSHDWYSCVSALVPLLMVYMQTRLCIKEGKVIIRSM